MDDHLITDYSLSRKWHIDAIYKFYKDGYITQQEEMDLMYKLSMMSNVLLFADIKTNVEGREIRYCATGQSACLQVCSPQHEPDFMVKYHNNELWVDEALYFDTTKYKQMEINK